MVINHLLVAPHLNSSKIKPWHLPFCSNILKINTQIPTSSNRVCFTIQSVNGPTLDHYLKSNFENISCLNQYSLKQSLRWDFCATDLLRDYSQIKIFRKIRAGRYNKRKKLSKDKVLRLELYLKRLSTCFASRRSRFDAPWSWNNGSSG